MVVEHTGVNTADEIRSILTEFGLELNSAKKIYAVSDGASNMRKAVKILNIPHTICFAHCLHNCITSTFEEPEIKELIAKSRSLIKHFRSSSKQTYALNKIQERCKFDPVKLKLDSETRWNSTWDMLNRLLKNRPAIVNLTFEEKK